MPTPLDVLIVGGGPAGLSAATYLGRARKSVVVLDRGNPRHAVSPAVHNMLTRDGITPQDLRSVAWQQLSAYPSVQHKSGTVLALERHQELWKATLDNETHIQARAVILATGVIDNHPKISGYPERWGHSIHHCPYCHGWEVRDQPLGVVAHGDAAGHMPFLLKGWSADVVLLTNNQPISDDVRAQLNDAKIPVYDAPIASLEGGPAPLLDTVVFADGTSLKRSALFVSSTQNQVPLVQALGVDLDENGYVAVNPFGATSIPGIWAAGDLTTRLQQVVEAAAQGARVGAMLNMALTLPHSPFQ